MSLRTSVLSVAAISTIVALSACSELPTQPAGHKAKRTSSLISKVTWTNMLPHTMSEEFCDNESDLLSCYSMSTEECHQSVEQITNNCTTSYSDQIPLKLGKADAVSWGGTIGNCTKTGLLQLVQSKNLTPASDACRQTVEDM